MELILVILATLVFVLFLATVGFALYYFGLFEDVQISVGSSPIPFTGQMVGYKLARGPYNKSGHLFTELIGDLVRILPDCTTDNLKTIGFYYDDPMETQESRLRYAVGVIFPDEKDEGWSKEAISTLESGLLSKGYKMTKLPKVDHVVYTSFPFRSTISIIIAVKRVYPIIRSYISRHNLCAHPALEVYTTELIYFILPLSKQDHFYLFDSEDEEDDDVEESKGGASAEHSAYSSDTDSESDRSSQGEAEPQVEEKESKTLRLRNKKTMSESATACRKDSVSSTQNSSSSFEEITPSDNL
jgi:hypothetical protein